MNARFLVLAVAILPLGGCTNASFKEESPALVVTAPPVPTNAAPSPAVLPEDSIPESQPVNTVSAPPENLNLTASAAEIVKLAQAGVAESVMLAYVTSSTQVFNLGSDEIVYLNDIGVPPVVVTSMIQFDAANRAAASAGTAASTAPPAANTWQQTATEPAPAAQVDIATTVPPAPPTEQPEPVTGDSFYNSLTPYGTWVDVAGYGRCWRPTVVANQAGWRPYVNGGRWMWTDAGWYWYSDYSWGWAPFHYGRWFSHSRMGWCWTPDTVWGPSWVSWRYSDNYCGWAPLPPAACYQPSLGFTYYGGSVGVSFTFGLTADCFTFVSYHNFHGRHYNQNCVPRHQTPHIYNNTTVVNNIIRGNNNTIINQGVAPERITAVTHQKIPRVRIQEVQNPHHTATARHENLTPDGRAVTVTRAPIPGRSPVTAGTAATLPVRSGAGSRNAGPRVSSLDNALASAGSGPTPVPPSGSAPRTGSNPHGALIVRPPQTQGNTVIVAENTVAQPAIRSTTAASGNTRPARAPASSGLTHSAASVAAQPVSITSSPTPRANEAGVPADPTRHERSVSAKVWSQPSSPRVNQNSTPYQPSSVGTVQAAPAPSPRAVETPAAPRFDRSGPTRTFDPPAPPRMVPSYAPPVRSPESHATVASTAPSAPPATRSTPSESKPSTPSRSSDSSDRKSGKSRDGR